MNHRTNENPTTRYHQLHVVTEVFVKRELDEIRSLFSNLLDYGPKMRKIDQ
jgi:hypothetical protein